MQCNHAVIRDVRDGIPVGYDIVCEKTGKVVGGCRYTSWGFNWPECYRLCKERSKS